MDENVWKVGASPPETDRCSWPGPSSTWASGGGAAVWFLSALWTVARARIRMGSAGCGLNPVPQSGSGTSGEPLTLSGSESPSGW